MIVAMIFSSRKHGARCMRIVGAGIAVGLFRKPSKEMAVAVYFIEEGVTDTFSKLDAMVTKESFTMQAPETLETCLVNEGFEMSGFRIPLNGDGEVETVRKFIYGRI